MAEARYIHSPLISENEIRLLHFESLSGDDIKCSLIHHDLDTIEAAEGYIALSYCWGGRDPDHKIDIGGKSFAVSSGLHGALQAVRRHLKRPDRQADYLWVDAISINQSDPNEKSLQVRRMDRIYNTAREVIVWLGEEDYSFTGMVMSVINWSLLQTFLTDFRMDDEIREFDKGEQRRIERSLQQYSMRTPELEAFYEILHTVTKDDWRSAALHTSESSMKVERQHSALRPNHPFWTYLLTFLTRPWFYRIWTFQEIKLARNARVLCGEDEMAWDSLLLVRKYLLYPGCTGTIYERYLLDIAVPDPYAIISGLHYDLDFSEGPKALQLVLKLLGGTKASDPRDYIYGIHSLLSEDIRGKLVVDYTLSALAVFLAAIELACDADNATAFLSTLLSVYSDIPTDRNGEWPSWCPMIPAKDAMSVRDYGQIGARMAQEYVVWGPQRVIFESGNIASLFGLRLGTIQMAVDFCAPRIQSAWKAWIVLRAQKADSVRWLRLIRRLFAYGQNDSATVFYKYFRYGTVSEPFATPDQLLEALIQVIENSTYLVTSTAESLGYQESYVQFVADMVEQFDTHNGRYYFVTDAGNIGYAALKVTPGQQVCYFSGGSNLHILSENCNRYITSAFVSGLQNDNISKTAEKGWEIFCLH